ncbi:hypothetical protein FOJ82_13785 [Tessaracoccus rhinocerotis]|uniref:Uncharacterized protein n=1 Tax=Tessaracoccus rhinocerotis TaxID=1689449 RepID=A0A553JWV6_9ACTN|nr:hypothetical protein [Tessaracoccus rhinocerotis]TRY16932.1 hypothetical protein FOJ82_13785 [Tessaracoccus rhinocerotis]
MNANTPTFHDTGTLPEVDGQWLRPSSDHPAEPRWGHPDGLQVGLSPTPGPRGLLRLFTPYLDHPRERLLNFVAVEPVVSGQSARGFSELEPSQLDGLPGKRFWSADSLGHAEPSDPQWPARGVVEEVDGVEHLTVWVHSERFENGAEVSVRVRFRADRPHEVSLAAFRRPGSAELQHCVLTATMGNFARLRELHLRDRVVTPAELWPGFERTDFAEHGRFGVEELQRSPDGGVVVAATPDERAPHEAVAAEGTATHWSYVGRRAVQGWRVPQPSPQLEVLVNGRWAYWASESPIPGGVSYENFEILEPFTEGQEFIYWAEPIDERDFTW